MTRQPAIAVVDLGASSGRVFAAVARGQRLCLREIHRFPHRPHKYLQRHLVTGALQERSCWDFARLWQGLCEGVGRMAQEDLEVWTLGIDTWGSDGVWLNAAGDMLGMIFTGRDSAWKQAQQELLERIPARRLFDVTGVQSFPFNVVNQLYWYCRHEPRQVEAAACYLPINGLLYYLLTGRRIAEWTWMSTTQLCPAGRGPL